MERKTILSRTPAGLLRAFCTNLLILSGIFGFEASAQSTNTCALANLFTVGTTCSYNDFDVAGSYSPDYDPGTCGATNNDDAWGRFVATSTTTAVTFDPDDNHRPVLHVFTGTCTTSLTVVGCVDAGSNGTNATLDIPTAVGTTYYVRVQRFATSQTMNGRLCVWSSPTNDTPCGAVALSVGTSCSTTAGTNVNTSNTPGIPVPGCGNYTGSDVWYSFVAPANGALTIRMTAGTLNNGAMAVYSAPSCSGTMTLIECDDSDGPGNMPFLTFSGNDLVPGDTYYLRVWGNANAQGTFNLCLETAPATGNCFYILRLFDLMGNGWGGSTLGISLGGGPVVNYTLATGDQDVVYIPFTSGQLLTATYTAAGGFQNEISYFVQLGDGVVFADGPTPNTGLVQAYFTNCIPPSPPPSDCSGGITVCGNQALNANPNNTGVKADLDINNRGCLLNDERQGYWYHFRIASSGTVAFTIAPVNSSDDYDFAIWGPAAVVQCPPNAAPYRCNYSGTTGNTGLSTTATNDSENSIGSKWSNAMTVVAGEVYAMYISNWSRSGLAFSLNWDLTNGASLDCTVLPIELMTFEGEAVGSEVELAWSTASENNSSHYVVERMNAESNYTAIGTVPAIGFATSTTNYSLVDPSPLPGTNLYRLRAVDQDGSSTTSEVVMVTFRDAWESLRAFPNPTEGDLNIDMDVVHDGNHGLRILDASGRLVRVVQQSFATGPQRFNTWVGDLAAGPYELILDAPDGTILKTGRLMKQ